MISIYSKKKKKKKIADTSDGTITQNLKSYENICTFSTFFQPTRFEMASVWTGKSTN